MEIDWGPFGTASGSGAITGSASTDLTATATNVSTVGGIGSFDVASFTATGLAFGTLAFDNFHVTITLPATTSTNGTNPFNPDIGGSIISVGGQVIQGGTSTLFDFSSGTLATPVTAPAGSLTTLDVANGTWTIPLTITTSFMAFSAPITITMRNDLILAVPEPGTLLLLGAGVAGLAAIRRRQGMSA